MTSRLAVTAAAVTVVLSLAACSTGGEAGTATANAPASASAATATSENRPSSPSSSATPEASSAPTATDEGDTTDVDSRTLSLTIGSTVLTATLADNSSVDALVDLLAAGPLTIPMRDYEQMEKVGPIGTDLPRNDEPITTQPGDLILYQGNALVIYYAPNTWDFTRIGRIDDTTAKELKKVLGPGDVDVTLSLG